MILFRCIALTVFFISASGWSAPRETSFGKSPFFPAFLPDEPQSEFVSDSEKLWTTYRRPGAPAPSTVPTVDFCSKWNPEFSHNGHRCCRNLASLHRRKARVSCFKERPRGSYCGEMTEEQIAYTDQMKNSSIDVLHLIAREMGSREQAYCTVNNGFLAYGRRILPTNQNRVEIRSPERCTNFGTDLMVGMIEWVGRKITEKYSAAPEYKDLHLLIGDVSPPRGGCLSGTSGLRGHLSHTNGQDADIGYLTPVANHASPQFFHRTFDAKANWWMIKQIFTNPYACVKVIFLDRRNIRKLAKVAAADEDWLTYRRFIRHQKGHRDHMHVRIGDWPGQPGCVSNPKPELESGDDPDPSEGDADAALDVGGE